MKADTTENTQAADLEPVRLQDSAKQLFEQIQQFRSKHFFKPFPPLLYHYTNVDGLMGIISGHKLWATHINYLNDSSEIVYTRSLVEEAIRKKATEVQSEIASAFIEKAYQSFDLTQVVDVYVSCFCEDGDLLSQWRGYAQRGDGYAIGVGAEALFESGFRGLKFFFGKVEYSRDKQERVIQSIITMVIDGLAQLTGGMSLQEAESTINQCCEVLRQSLWHLLAASKNALFSEENEWRAMCLLPKRETLKRVQFRSSGNKLIPYIEVAFARPQDTPVQSFPIAQIFHGPTLHPELSKSSLKLLLGRYGYPHVEVMGSKIPLRV